MDATTAGSSLLIGGIFVDKGLISAEQLERALQLQGESGERLGEILVTRFGIARLDLASALAEQWAVLERESKAGDAAAAGTQSLPQAIAPPPDMPAPLAPAPEVLAPPARAVPPPLAPEVLAPPARAVPPPLALARDALAPIAPDVPPPLAPVPDVTPPLAPVAVEPLPERPPPERMQQLQSGARLAEPSGEPRDTVSQAPSPPSPAPPDARPAEPRGGLRDTVSQESSPPELLDRLRALEEREEQVRAALAALRGHVDELRTALAARVESPARTVPDEAGRPGHDAVDELRHDLDRLASVVEENDAASIDERELLRSELEHAVATLESRLALVETGRAPDLAAGIEPSVPAGAASERTSGRREPDEAPGASAAGEAPVSLLLLVPVAEGYRLVEVVREPPGAGEPVAVPGHDDELVAMRVGRSPLPLDPRPCAYLERR